MIDKLQREIFLSEHSSFRIGGITKFAAEPHSYPELLKVLSICLNEGYEPIIYGFGSNTLFPDSPSSKQCFISLKKLIGFYIDDKGMDLPDKTISLLCGTPISMLALIGIITGEDYDFTYLLPGSIGAGVYINARYLEREISNIVSRIHYIDVNNLEGGLLNISGEDCQFGYKDSVFQGSNRVIIAVEIEFSNQDKEGVDYDYLSTISRYMEQIRENSLSLCNISMFNRFFRRYRWELKPGKEHSTFNNIESHRNKYRHFEYPSAGSIFKNSRELGKPIGAVIEELGLKGIGSGDALISPHHGNIIINIGKANASDVLKLIDIITEAIFKAYCFEPKLEIKII